MNRNSTNFFYHFKEEIIKRKREQKKWRSKWEEKFTKVVHIS
jgi:hypothetical protein